MAFANESRAKRCESVADGFRALGVTLGGDGVARVLLKSMPESATLAFTRPAIFAALTDAELQARLGDTVAKLVKRAREDMVLRGLPFVGRNAVLRQSFSATPKTPAPRRNPSPRIAAKSTPVRVNAIRQMLEFVREYRAAWIDWRAGNRNAVFPRVRTPCASTRA